MSLKKAQFCFPALCMLPQVEFTLILPLTEQYRVFFKYSQSKSSLERDEQQQLIPWGKNNWLQRKPSPSGITLFPQKAQPSCSTHCHRMPRAYSLQEVKIQLNAHGKNTNTHTQNKKKNQRLLSSYCCVSVHEHPGYLPFTRPNTGFCIKAEGTEQMVLEQKL